MIVERIAKVANTMPPWANAIMTKMMEKLPGVEFVQRFLGHVLPATQFRYIRHYGFLAPNKRGQTLPQIRRLLGMPAMEQLAEEKKNDDPLEGCGDSQEHRRTCRKCRHGRLLRGPEFPRPRVSDIMRLPLLVSRHRQLPGPWLPAPVATPPPSPPLAPLQLSLPLKLIYLEYW